MLTLSEVKNKYGYSRSTLLRWEREGKIHPQRTPGGHRRYIEGELDNIENVTDWAQVNMVTTSSNHTSETSNDTATKDTSGYSERSAQYEEWGITGLKQYAGSVQEERVRELRGRNGRKIKRQMRLDDPVIAAIFFGIANSMRQAGWHLKPHDESNDADKQAADFVESCLFDMSFTWNQTLTFIIDEMLEQGFSLLEVIYKRRLGENPPPYCENPAKSMYNDGRIGWRKWAIRPAESLADGQEWIFDEHGGIQGIKQQPLYTFGGKKSFATIEIPIEKLLHFRTTVHPANNPEGVPIHRGMYTAWWLSSNIQEVEGIGIERDLSGIPVMYLGKGTTRAGANSDYEMAKKLVVNIRNDEQAGVVLPYPKLGTAGEGEGVLLELLSTSSRRQYDTSEILNRYDKRKAMAVLAQFIMLGMDRVGSYALSKHQGDLFVLAVSAWLEDIAQVINRHAIPKLIKLNVFPGISGYPQLIPGTVGMPDLEVLGKFVNDLVGANIIVPDAELERTLRSYANLPMPSVDVHDNLVTTQDEEDIGQDTGHIEDAVV